MDFVYTERARVAHKAEPTVSWRLGGNLSSMAEVERVEPPVEQNGIVHNDEPQAEDIQNPQDEEQKGPATKDIQAEEPMEEVDLGPPQPETDNIEAAEPQTLHSRHESTLSSTSKAPLPPSPPPESEKPVSPQTPTAPANTNTPSEPDAVRSVRTSAETSSAVQRSAPVSSIVFVIQALEQIAASKDAKKTKPLGDSANKALAMIKKKNEAPDPEMIFEPLRLATETSNISLTTTALDCIGKLISYSYFSIPAPVQDPSTPIQQQPVPLIERAIDTICDCFQNEATPAEIQLQIVKSLLAAVLNDKIIVHGSGLLKAVRQIYNIFLLSKSPANQQVAQGTLTQMVGTVFERVNNRLSMKEARLNMSKLTSERGTANTSQADLNGTTSAFGSEIGTANEVDGVSEAQSVDAQELEVSDKPARKEPKEKLTLQSFENAKSFDDAKIGDNAPTMVTHAKSPLPQLRTPSGQPVPATNGDVNQYTPDEDEEDEIYVKDAFLVFRSMCRLSTKSLSPDQLQDVRSSNMRSKLISLAIIRTLLNNNAVVFTSPLVVIRSSSSNEPTSFGQAINQYLRLSLSRNGASSSKQVFETCAEIFWLMVKHMRVMLKVCGSLGATRRELLTDRLPERNRGVFERDLSCNLREEKCTELPKALRYENTEAPVCGSSSASGNLLELRLRVQCYRRYVSTNDRAPFKLSIAPVLISAQQQQQYQEQQSKEADADLDWQDTGRLPPSLTNMSLNSTTQLESELPVDYLLKQQGLDCLVRTLRSLVNWSQDSLAVTAAKLESMDLPESSEHVRDSLDPGRGTGSPRISAVDTPSLAPLTPQLEDDPSQLEKAKARKTALSKDVAQFNFKPKRGIKALLKDGFIKSEEPEDVAAFIFQNENLDKAMIGEFLGEGDPQNVAIMHAFVDSMDFTRRRFVDALRQFLQSFRLPGEAQKIDRFMLKFAERYIAGNPNAFANADTAYVLAYSVIMLNTDQHSSKMKQKRMTVEDFIKNNRGINDNADLPDEYLTSIFDEIAHNEIVLNTEREHAAALGIVPQPPQGGIASRAGQAFLQLNRDLQKEAYAQASEEMSSKAEQRLRSMIKAQKKTTSRQALPKYIPATSFKHVGPMFDATWMSFLSGLSGQMQDTQNIDVIRLCMEGLRLSIRISCLFDLATPREAFVTALAKFTNLGNLREMMAKNFEALRILLEVARQKAIY